MVGRGFNDIFTSTATTYDIMSASNSSPSFSLRAKSLRSPSISPTSVASSVAVAANLPTKRFQVSPLSSDESDLFSFEDDWVCTHWDKGKAVNESFSSPCRSNVERVSVKSVTSTKSSPGLPQENGSLVFHDGQVYDGTHRRGIRHGFGRNVWPDMSVYEGEWSNGSRSGKGTHTWPVRFRIFSVSCFLSRCTRMAAPRPEHGRADT